MEIIGKLCKKLEKVENIIDFKKGETNFMNEPTVHCLICRVCLQFSHLISMCPCKAS